MEKQLLGELINDPRSYALVVAIYGWWVERQRTKDLHIQIRETMAKLTDALLKMKGGL